MAIPKEPATMRSDLMMPKMPAVAIAPTPMKRTYPRKIWLADISAIGIEPGATAMRAGAVPPSR